MAIEKQLDFLVEKFGTFEQKLDQLDSKVTTLESSVTEARQQIGQLDASVGRLDAHVGQLDAHVGRLDAHVGTLDGNVGALGSAIGKMDARLGTVEKKVEKLIVTGEDTRDLVKLSLEGLAGLRDSTAASFRTMSKEHAEQIDLHKTTLVHIRKRVQRVERRKPRSR